MLEPCCETLLEPFTGTMLEPGEALLEPCGLELLAGTSSCEPCVGIVVFFVLFLFA